MATSMTTKVRKQKGYMRRLSLKTKTFKEKYQKKPSEAFVLKSVQNGPVDFNYFLLLIH